MTMILMMLLCASSFAKNEMADPCRTTSVLPEAENRGSKDKTTNGKEVCDADLTDGWYKAEGLILQTIAADINTCGTKFPYWMNETHPTVEDGEVNRTVCMANNTNCDSTMNIKVKNCSCYYVYFLPKTSGCPKGYCFGAANPCPQMNPDRNIGVTSKTSFIHLYISLIVTFVMVRK